MARLDRELMDNIADDLVLAYLAWSRQNSSVRSTDREDLARDYNATRILADPSVDRSPLPAIVPLKAKPRQAPKNSFAD